MQAKKDRAIFIHDLIEFGATRVRLPGSQEIHIPLSTDRNI
jgi:hypothetical protein